jgi:hypothetical protein
MAAYLWQVLYKFGNLVPGQMPILPLVGGARQMLDGGQAGEA